MNAHTPNRFDGPLGDLLLTSVPLMRLLRGERLRQFRQAWINAALGLASDTMRTDEGRLPTSPRAAALALYEAVVELCDRLGVEGPELAAQFNNRRERGEYARPASPDESIERCAALLAVVHARRVGERS